MPDKIQSAKLICRGGLNSNNNYLELSDMAPGTATRLINYEPSLFGGYRRIEGFAPLDAEYPEVDPTNAEGPILGVMIYEDTIIAARKKQGSATYGVYFLDSGGWTEYTTGLTLTSTGVDRIRYETFNFDGTEVLTFVDGVNNATVFDGTNWINIDPSATGADFANAGGIQALAKPSYVAVFYNHIFYSGDSDYPHLVVHSSPFAEYDFTSAGGAGQIIAGFKVNQIKPFRESLFVFGLNNIKKINVSNTTFLINDVAKNIGCVASDSVVEINGDILFLSQDGIRPITATERIGDVELSNVSKSIQELVRERITNSTLSAINAVTIPSKSQIRIFFSGDEVDTRDAIGIIGGLKSSDSGFYWEWGELWGIRSSCSTSAYINSTEYIIHGDYNGRVYRQEQGSSFDGDNIFSVYQTPYLDYSDPQIRKTLRKVSIFSRPEGPLDIDVGVNYDYGVSDVHNPRDYMLQSGNSFSTYGSITYDNPDAKYGGITSPLMATNIQGSGYSVQFTFVSDNTNSPYSIQGLLFEFSVNGRN
tara:strand:- start:578 stop:2176 length:1599 start_codon:yes stop_codon:yes gene_type:complete